MKNSQILFAAVLLAIGVLLFSLQDAIFKSFAGNVSLTLALTIRSVVALPIVLVIAAAFGIRRRRAQRERLLVLRSLALFAAYLLFNLSIAAIPLADAVALSFCSPIILAGLAVLILKERVRAYGILALLLGLVGVLTAVRPTSIDFEWAALLPIASALCYGVAQIIARKAGDQDDAFTMALYQNGVVVVIAPVCAAALSFVELPSSHPSVQFLAESWAFPRISELALMATCGAISAIASTLLIQAYRTADASRVAVFEYSGILWGPLWGFIFFAEVPRWTMLVGALFICSAGIVALWSERPATLPAKLPGPGCDPETALLAVKSERSIERQADVPHDIRHI